MTKRFALVCFLIGFNACAPSLAPLTVATGDVGTSDDEVFIGEQGKQVAAEVERAGLIYDDPDLTAYVAEIGTRVTPAPLAPEHTPRFHVIRCPNPNAFSLPQGDVYICIGLLTAMRNEAELAQVLAHEVAHVVKRHALASLVGRHRKAAAFHTFDIITLGIGGGLAGIPYVLTVTRYERSQEEEADADALAAVAAAGYDVDAAARLYERLGEHPLFGPKVTSVFNTHPAVAERLEFIRETVESASIARAGNVTAVERYEEAVADLPPQQLSLLLDVKRYAEAQRYARELMTEQPESASLHCFLGEAHRGMAEDPDAAAREKVADESAELDDRLIESFAARIPVEAQSAAEQYDRCLSLDPDSPIGHRGRGMIAIVRGENEQARRMLSRYLELSPEADDRPFIEHRLVEIGDE